MAGVVMMGEDDLGDRGLPAFAVQQRRLAPSGTFPLGSRQGLLFEAPPGRIRMG